MGEHQQTNVAKYTHGFGLVGRITYFLAESNPLFVMAGAVLLLLLIGLAFTGRRRPLFLMLLMSLTLNGSIWVALDAYSAILRIFLIVLLALPIVRLRNHPGLPILVFGSYIALGVPMTVFSPDVLWTIQYAGLLLLTLAACATLADSFKTKRDVASFCALFLVAAVVWAAVGASSLSALAKQGAGGKRFAGGTETAGLFTQIGGILLPFVVWGVMRPWSMKWRASSACLAVVMLFVLLVSGQRAGTLAGILGSLPLLARLRSSKVLVGVGILGAVALMALQAASFNRAQTDFVVRRYLQGDLSNRDKIWAAGIQEILESPVLGHGFGANKRTLKEEIGKYIHSMYLAIWYDTGILGMVLAIAGMALGSWQAFVLMRRAKDPEINEASRLMLGLFMNIGANGVFGSGASSASDLATVALLTAMVMTSRLKIFALQGATEPASDTAGARAAMGVRALPEATNPYAARGWGLQRDWRPRQG